MELFPLLFLLAIVLAEITRDRTPPEPSQEKRLGDAVTKILTSGVKVQIVTDDGKKKS